jgi:hypothetical protein
MRSGQLQSPDFKEVEYEIGDVLEPARVPHGDHYYQFAKIATLESARG